MAHGLRPRWPLLDHGPGQIRAHGRRELARLIDEELAADAAEREVMEAEAASWKAELAECHREFELTPLYGDSFDFDRDDWHMVVA